jgi:hypothetical protein
MENRNDVFLPTIQISDFNRSEKWVEFLSKSRTSLCINIYNLTPVESNSDKSKFRLSRIKVLVPRCVICLNKTSLEICFCAFQISQKGPYTYDSSFNKNQSRNMLPNLLFFTEETLISIGSLLWKIISIEAYFETGFIKAIIISIGSLLWKLIGSEAYFETGFIKAIIISMCYEKKV